MFRLHGSPISNFYNIVKLTLLEKGLDFEEVPQPPSQGDDFLAISPLGKIPVLQVREGYMSETGAIVDFLEDVYPEIPLFPSDPYKKALVRRLCHMAEVYIDVPARPMLVSTMSGVPLSEEHQVEIRQTLEKNALGIVRVSVLSPWVCGDEFTAADIFLYYCLGLVDSMAKDHLKFDLYSHLPGYEAWRENVTSRSLVQQVDADNKAAMEAFLKQRNS